MSHELRTPLNAIIGFSELHRDGDVAQAHPDLGEDLERIHASGLHLLELITDVLDAAQLEEGTLPLHVARFPLDELVLELADMATTLAARRRNTFRCTVDPDVGWIETDRRRLHHALEGLLVNAAKFTTDGAIELAVTRTDHQVSFRVVDTGVGMTSEQQARAFDLFYLGDDSITRRQEGAGIGLAVARRVVQRMGGDIAVDSTPGRGSAFTVTLPCSASDHAGAAPAAETRAHAADGAVRPIDTTPPRAEPPAPPVETKARPAA
jgi:Amt family ammonium transporter